MGDSMTVLVALFALCAVGFILIWQVATLADSVNGLDEDMRATAKWFARSGSRSWEQSGSGRLAARKIGEMTMKISDELKRISDSAIVCGHARVALRDLADLIDAEMVELPKDSDGVPIHVGDTVYLESGRKATVNSIELSHGEQSIHFSVCGNLFSLSPEKLSHVSPDSPDSLEIIADDIEASKGVAFISDSTLSDWADRIRRLAQKEDRR